jgi:single-strand DNA-binding protein
MNMNKVTIIGNLTADPELRTTQTGVNVCSFTVAVNRRFGQQNETDFFRVSAWRKTGEMCAQYLAKGRKVAVTGPVTARAYNDGQGNPRASLEVTADDVEFLTPKSDGAAAQEHNAQPAFTMVQDEELPF